eukprot:1188346-Rhodomonas_salina.1
MLVPTAVKAAIAVLVPTAIKCPLTLVPTAVKCPLTSVCPIPHPRAWIRSYLQLPHVPAATDAWYPVLRVRYVTGRRMGCQRSTKTVY